LKGKVIANGVVSAGGEEGVVRYGIVRSMDIAIAFHLKD
jgi:hypothetical protein